MLEQKSVQKIALLWIEAWNRKDIPAILSYYDDDVVFYSPTVPRRWNIAEGKLFGKEALEKHFRKAMEEVPGMHIELLSILFGLDSFILVYRRENTKLAADEVILNNQGKVKEVKVFC